MQVQEENLGNQIKNLTIAQQFVFLVESFSQTQTDDSWRENYLYAVMGACLADLFLFQKIKLQNSKVSIANIEKTNYEYLDRILYELNSVLADKTMLDVLSILSPKMEEVEKLIVDNLITIGLLREKRDGFLFFGSKVIYPANNDIVLSFIESLRISIEGNNEPEKPMIYLETLLDTIHILPKIFESKKELDYGQKRLENFIENDHIARILLRAITNEIKLQDLKHMTRQRSGSRFMR